MGARVSWRDAAGLSGVVELSYAEIFIGRAMECAIRTDDPMVSRRHARIYFQDGRHIIEDLGSANGIYVGDVRTQMHILNNGDGVRAGNLWITYQSDGMMTAAPQSFGAAPTAAVAGIPGFGGSGGYGGAPMAAGGYGGMGGVAAAPAAAPAPMVGGYGAPGGGDMSPPEFQRLQRRVDQLQSEIRLLRGGGEGALRMEELETKISRLEQDKMELEKRCMELEQLAAQGGGGGGVQIGTAQLQLGRAEEVVNGLNDILSELRINVLAADGEAEQWEKQLPRASYDLVRDSLRLCRVQMEQVKDLMRQLRAEAQGRYDQSRF